MNCRSLQEQLPDYLDDELPPPHSAALAAHLKICDDCRAQLHALASTQKTVRTALDRYPRIKATPDFDLRVLEAATQRQSQAASLLDWFDTFFARPLPKLLGSSVVGILFGVLLFATFLPRPTLANNPTSAPDPASIAAIQPAAPRLYALDNWRYISRAEFMRKLGRDNG
ncbi:MAG: zf-HC2 domain-containing protein [Armatimonadota bacterium]|nr:zf-HC2 domain-containing protein [Armatimonadota bacterium]